MEIIPQNSRENPQKSPQRRNLFIGIVLILVGMLWLMDNLNLLPYRLFDILISWQMLLILIGVFLLYQRLWVGGTVVTTIGVLFFISNQLGYHLSFRDVGLPVVFIVAGIAVILSRSLNR